MSTVTFLLLTYLLPNRSKIAFRHSVMASLSPLREITTYVTGHREDGKTVVQEKRPANWKPLDNDRMAFNIVYTTSQFPVDVSDDADLKTHEKVISSGELGLVNPNGTVCRVVDFEPGYECLMHRTESLDYGILIEGNLTHASCDNDFIDTFLGEVDMIMDSGEVQKMGRGDVAVQRATMHAWRNNSTAWARMIFVLQECKKVRLGKEVLGASENVKEMKQ